MTRGEMMKRILDNAKGLVLLLEQAEDTGMGPEWERMVGVRLSALAELAPEPKREVSPLRLDLGEVVRVEPESPRRLRECLSALAKHDGTSVLRVELSLGRATTEDGAKAPAFGMMVTHSLGVEHEEKLAPSLMQTFATAIQGTLVEAEERGG